MRAAMFYGPGDVRVEDVPMPEPGPEEIVVQVKTATTCGTDVKAFLRGYPNLVPPTPFGHELAGDIVAMGAEVPTIRPDLTMGARVVTANSAPCHHCPYCRNGQQSLCENLTLLWGAFADYIRIPARIVRDNTYVLPDDLAYRDACLMEPLACVVHGLEQSHIRLGDTVAVNGAGPIGLMFVKMAVLKGARVLVTDLSAERLAVAARLGASHTIQVIPGTDAIAAVRALTEGSRGVDVAVDAVGLPAVWEAGVAMVRKGGLVTLFGGPKPGTTFNLDTNLVHYAMLTLKGVYHHMPYYVRMALKIIERKHITSADFVTKELPLEEVSAALQLHRDHRVIKAGILPGA
jgi:L-iditol 2-dehydrogenase